MKEQYVEPQMELVEFPCCDVIATSTYESTSPPLFEDGIFTLPEWGNGGEVGDEWL